MLGRTFYIFQHIVVPQAHDLPAFAGQESGASSIICCGIRMVAAINLHGDLRRAAR